MIRTASLTLAALALVLLAPGAAAEVFDVEATSSNTFTPMDLTINVGDTIEWTATGGSHTVTSTDSLDDGERSPNGIFDQSIAEGGAPFVFTFNQAGTYHYYCKPHSGLDMMGTITVQDAGGSGGDGAGDGNGDGDTESSPAPGLAPLLVGFAVIAFARRR